MSAQTKPNITSIIGLKEGINQIFSLIEHDFDIFAKYPSDITQIDSCRRYYYQLDGLLEMLELNSITTINGNVEQLMGALIEKETEPNQNVLDALRQITHALHHYLNELIEGKEDNPLRLFPAYQTLMHAAGFKHVSESDLFFPQLITKPTLKSEFANTNPFETKALIKQARIKYQAGLLQWLRDTANKDGLQEMVLVTNQIEQVPGSLEQRTFWWVATGFLEGLLQQEDIDLTMRRICGKIEQTIRHLAEGTPGNTAQLIRELLYHIANSDSATERINEIKQTYEWPDLDTANEEQSVLLTPEEAETLQKTLGTMHSTLMRANDNWRGFCSGQQENLTLLSANSGQLIQLAGSIQCLPLEKLIAAINDTIQYLQNESHDMDEGLAMEMASALLLVENTLENFHKLPTELSSQVETLSARLHALIQEESENEGELSIIPRPPKIELNTQETKPQTQAAQEILENLGQIEKVLDKFFAEPTERTELSTLSFSFKQIEGVFTMLNLEHANTLLNRCHDLVKKLANPQYVFNQIEQDLLADGLSSLGFFVEALENEQPDSHKIIDEATSLFDSVTISDSKTSDKTIDSSYGLAKTEVAANSEIEPELLDVFLEEADEVLANIAHYLASCHVNPTDTKALTELRRGFHTLKGSGRMVKLTSLSEVAWSLEQVLEHWLNESKFATQELLQLVTLAHQEFSTWCDNLKQFGKTNINADDLLLTAKRLINDRQSTPDSTTENQETIIQDSSSKQQQIAIGDQTIPLDLFEIYKTESNQHLATLNNALEHLLASQNNTINHSFVLASHTLASISNTLGLSFISEPGFALEQWLTKLFNDTARPDEYGIQLIQNTITLMGNLQEQVHNQQSPDKTQIQSSKALSLELIERLKLATQHSAETQNTVSTESLEQIAPPSNGQIEDGTNTELLSIFLEETQEIIPQIGAKLRAWRILPEDSDIYRTLLRLLHTLKGNARMANVRQLGEQVHDFEGDVEAAFIDHKISTSTLNKLEDEFGAICKQIEQLQIAEITSDRTKLTETTPSLTTIQSIPEISTEGLDTSQQKTMLRVSSKLIDQLVSESGEVSITRSKIETQLNNFKQSLQDLTDSVDRLHGQLREVEIQAETQMQSHLAQKQDNEQVFDPLEFDRFTRLQELTRLMAESVDDVLTVQKNLRATHNTAEEALSQQSLVSRKLQQALMHIRTLRFSHFSERYYRIVRQVASDVGKKARLEIQGDEIEIDRSVLDKINTPLEHLLRNAVAHGIEAPEKRAQLGKPETGQIIINLCQEGNEVIITLSDDGNGLDIPLIREKALQLGLIQENESLDNDQIMSLIYAQGLSTAKTITSIAGRGIGMDIVKNEVSTLGGRITVHSVLNQGTTFNIHIPLTLAVAQTLLVRSEQQIYAIPTVIVDHIQEVNTDVLNEAYQNHNIQHNEKIYPFAHLSHLLGAIDHAPEVRRHNRILLLQSGTVPLAIHVDELIGNSELIVKNVGAQLKQAPGIEGATVTGEGDVILILNPVKLAQRKQAQAILTAAPKKPSINVQRPLTTTLPTVMIVDDSLTVRRVTSRLLEREGYEVLIAKNGLDAIELLREITPDVLLIDLEMPKMDGFELIRNIRNHPETADVPIIIISSRTADKHRAMADKLGVNIFLGKPYQEEALLGHISKFVQK